MTNWDNLKLWYDKPAQQWVEALPVGCGRLGAMVYGQIQNERIQFNEDTLWTGKPHEYHRKSAVKHLPQIRQLLFDGKQEQAEQLAFKYFMGNPKRQKAYQPCGDLLLSFPEHEQATNYYRDLNLDTGITTTTYQVNDVIYTREVFASYPAQAIVIRLSANKPGQLTFTASLDSPHARLKHQVLEDAQIALTGKVARNPMAFEARLLTRVKKRLHRRRRRRHLHSRSRRRHTHPYGSNQL